MTNQKKKSNKANSDNGEKKNNNSHTESTVNINSDGNGSGKKVTSATNEKKVLHTVAMGAEHSVGGNENSSSTVKAKVGDVTGAQVVVNEVVRKEVEKEVEKEMETLGDIMSAVANMMKEQTQTIVQEKIDMIVEKKEEMKVEKKEEEDDDDDDFVYTGKIIIKPK